LHDRLAVCTTGLLDIASCQFRTRGRVQSTAPGVLNERENIFPLEESDAAALLTKKPSFFGFVHHMEKIR
jgi:hypothetical protein